jgi:hypothetical protein
MLIREASSGHGRASHSVRIFAGRNSTGYAFKTPFPAAANAGTARKFLPGKALAFTVL